MTKLTFKQILIEYMENSSLHGAKFVVDEKNHILERIFWMTCIILSWVASGLLIKSSWDAFQNNAISFVVETSYRDWDTNFPSIVVCEAKNMDRVQEIAERLWGSDHDFTLEEVLSEIAYFRGESYHTVHECGVSEEQCIVSNFSYYAQLVRSDCSATLDTCRWNNQPFDCCTYFQRMETELGYCYALNSKQMSSDNGKRLKMISNKYTGPGKLNIEVLTEANIYILGEEDVPNLVTSKSEVLTVGPYISYTRLITLKNIENDPLTRSVSVEQRSCRFSDENILGVHKQYSYSACSVQCRKDRQMVMCNCTSHLMPNTDPALHCDINGLRCLNDNYDELSVVIAKWSYGKKGVVCDCLPSCTEIDIAVVHDSRVNINGHHRSLSMVEIGLAGLPTERYKRNVIRGTLDLVVSMGGTTGLFIGASVLSFVEVFYYFTIRPYGTSFMQQRLMENNCAHSAGNVNKC